MMVRSDVEGRAMKLFFICGLCVKGIGILFQMLG
jgi:hypothetical protein